MKLTRHCLALTAAIALAAGAEAQPLKPAPVEIQALAPIGGGDYVDAFGPWKLYTAETPDRICYIVAAADAGSFDASDEPSYLYVTRYPGADPANEISVLAPIKLDPTGPAALVIGEIAYPMFVEGDYAWSERVGDSTRIIAAATSPKAVEAVLTATALGGQAFTQSYPLMALTEALAALNEACPR